MNDPHAAARLVLRGAAEDARKFADKIDATIAAVRELYGPAGVERLTSDSADPVKWAADKRALAAELHASADALRPAKVTT